MAYTPTTWVNGGVPAINDTNLNHMETQYAQALTDIPEDQAAGTPSERTLGTGAVQAAPGDHIHPLVDRGRASARTSEADGLDSTFTMRILEKETTSFTTNTSVAQNHSIAGSSPVAIVTGSTCYANNTGATTGYIQLLVGGVELGQANWAVPAQVAAVQKPSTQIKDFIKDPASGASVEYRVRVRGIVADAIEHLGSAVDVRGISL